MAIRTQTSQLSVALRRLVLPVLALLLSACGGQGSGVSGPEHSAGQRISSKSVLLTVLPDTYIAGGTAEAIEVVERQGKDELLVDVSVKGAESLKAFFFHLEYDKSRFSAGRLDNPWLLGPESECLALYLTEPSLGVVEFGELLMLPQEPRADGSEKGFSGDGLLCTLHLKTGAGTGVQRKPSAAPDSDGAKSALSYDGTSQTLEWLHFSPGDYNQDGQVAVSDLTPIGIHFNKDVPAGSDPDGRDNSSIEDVVDGSNDGKVNVSDLTAIGLNFQDRVSSYNIYEGTLADLPSSNSGANGAGASLLASIPFSQNSGNAGTARVGFSHVLGPLPAETVYWVRPNDAADGSGADGTASSPVDSASFNQPPVASIVTSPLPFTEAPAQAEYIVTASTDPDGSISLYEFDGESDGTFEQSFSSDPIEIQHTYNSPGLHTATLRVTDNKGASSSSTAEVEVRDPSNMLPECHLTLTPDSGPAPLAVQIDLSSSSDPDGSIVLYEVDLDFDGIYELSSSTSGVFDHLFEDGFDFYVAARVTDDQGSRSANLSALQVVDAANLAPIADLSSDVQSGPEPLEVHFDASGSLDTDGQVVKYIWDFFGDGSQDLITSEPYASFTYSGSGEVTASVTAIDNDGTSSAPDSLAINVSGGWELRSVQIGSNVSDRTFLLSVLDVGPEIKPLVCWSGSGDDYGKVFCMLGNASGEFLGNRNLITDKSIDQLDLHSVNGLAAIAYNGTNPGGLYFSRANDAEGSNWSAPVGVDTSNFNLAGFGVSLSLVNSKPAVAYNPINSAPLFRQAQDALGSSWSSGTLLQLDQKTTSPVLLGGLERPLVVAREFDSMDITDSLLGYPGADADGSAFSAPFDFGPDYSLFYSAAMAGGRAFVCYSDYNLVYCQRSTSGEASGWEAASLVDSPQAFPLEMSMAEIAGVPAIAYVLNNGQLWYCEAGNSSASVWKDPQCIQGTVFANEVSLASWNNRPAVSYGTGGGGSIHFAFLP